MILDTKEAQAKAQELHKAHLETMERERNLELKAEINAIVQGSLSDAADGQAASPSSEAGAPTTTAAGEAASASKSIYDATVGGSGVNGDDASNKRSLEGGDSDSPSRSNGSFNSKRRRRM